MKLNSWFVAIVALAGSVGVGGCQLEGNALAYGMSEVYEEEVSMGNPGQGTLADGTPIFRVPQTKIDAVKVLDLYQQGRLRILAPGARTVFILTPVVLTQAVQASKAIRYVKVQAANGTAAVQGATMTTDAQFDLVAFLAGRAMSSCDSHVVPAAPAVGSASVITAEYILLPDEALYVIQGGVGAQSVVVSWVDLELGVQGQ